MGVRAGVTEITPEAFREMLSGGNPDIKNEASYGLDKAWSDIHDMLQPEGDPLRHAITGDAKHPDCLESYDEFIKGDAEYYAGFASPELVKRIAEALMATDMPDVPSAKDWNENDRNAYSKYVESRFEVLKEAYGNAARNSKALMIVIA